MIFILDSIHTEMSVCCLLTFWAKSKGFQYYTRYFSLLIGNIFYLADARRGKSLYVCTTYIVYAYCIQCRKSLRYLPYIVHSRVMHILKIIELQNLQRNIQYFFHRLFHAKVNKIHKTYCLISFL